MKSKQLIKIHKQFFNAIVSLVAPMQTRIGKTVSESHPGISTHLNGLLIQFIKSVYAEQEMDKPIGFALYLWKTKNTTYPTDRHLDTSSLLYSPFVHNFCYTRLCESDYEILCSILSQYETILKRAIYGWSAKCKSAGMPAVVDGFEFFERDMDELIGNMLLLQVEHT